MSDHTPLIIAGHGATTTQSTALRVLSLDVFRGISIFLMIFVDYAGSTFPSVAHAPWKGLHLADFVMPFFLFIAGVSLALTNKRVSTKTRATYKAILRTIKLFLLGIFLQGGYFHGINSLTYGVDMEKIRWLGILQRIAIAYIIAALCEIWSSNFSPSDLTNGYFHKYYLQWFTVMSLSCIYTSLLYGMYVPDWEYAVHQPSIFPEIDHDISTIVNCSVRGDLGPACNSAGMIDRYFLGIEHLYRKPSYKNLRECSALKNDTLKDPSAWCQAPFDPEGILSSLMASVTCLIGLHFGHVLIQENHKGRLRHWSLFSISLLVLGLLFSFAGIPIIKSLYTMSYMLVTTASAGIIFCTLYFLVDILCYRSLFFVFEFIGRHALSIFVLIASNMLVILIQGFYWKTPDDNIIHWIVSFVPK